MNTSIFRSTLLALAAAALPHTANAMLLVGWHDFDGTADPELHDDFASGFSGTVSKNTDSRSLGGDNGGVAGIFYGNSNIASGSGNDGLLRLVTGAPGNIFSMTNNSGASVALASLFFDATSAPGTVLQVAYRIGTDAFQTIGSFNGLNETGDFTNPALQDDFSDLSQSLVGITLANLQTLDVRFTISTGGARLDNIAITAIPEPASLIGLGLVLGSGLLLRQRPRHLSPSLV